jgi:hypothetical protein
MEEEKIWSIFDIMNEFVSGINGMTELCSFTICSNVFTRLMDMYDTQSLCAGLSMI